MAPRKTLPWPLRGTGRALLRAWGDTGIAPGWRYHVIERWGAVLAEDEPLPTLLPGGLAFRADLRDFVERFAYFLGVSEPIEMSLVASLLTPGMTIVDGGANNGQYTLIAALAVGPRGHVLAFEPVPENFAKLEHHVRLNRLDNVVLYRTALWDQAAKLQFARPKGYDDNAGTWGTGIADAPGYLDVDAVAFDDLALPPGAGPVGFIKLDVEGSELHALRGLRRTIERDQPLLFVELSRRATERAGGSIDELWAYLTATLGYHVWKIGSTPALSGPITDIAGVENANAICYRGEPPEALARGWDYRAVMTWARSGTGKRFPIPHSRR